MLEDERCSAEGELFGLQLLRKGERKRRELQGKCKKCNESGGVEEGGGEGGRGGGSGGQAAKKISERPGQEFPRMSRATASERE